jgi:acyl carrier protein
MAKANYQLFNMGIEDQIKQFISQNLLFSDSGFALSEEVSFLKEGVIDSIGVMELVTFAGDTFGITIDPAEITPDNFDSIAKLAAYIRRKKAVAA